MAKLISLEGTLSGSIGARTYSHNKGGPYIRRRGIPTTPASVKQTASRTILAYLSAYWSNTLTNTQRAAWNDRGATVLVPDTMGTMIALSGQQQFIALNARLIGAGSGLNASPPVTATPPPLLTAVITPTAPSSLSLAFTTTPLPAGERVAVWMSLPGLPGKSPNQAQARLVGYSAAAATSPAVLTTPYPMVTGQQFNYWVTVMDNTGQVSGAIEGRATVP